MNILQLMYPTSMLMVFSLLSVFGFMDGVVINIPVHGLVLNRCVHFFWLT